MFKEEKNIFIHIYRDIKREVVITKFKEDISGM